MQQIFPFSRNLGKLKDHNIVSILDYRLQKMAEPELPQTQGIVAWWDYTP